MNRAQSLVGGLIGSLIFWSTPAVGKNCLDELTPTSQGAAFLSCMKEMQSEIDALEHRLDALEKSIELDVLGEGPSEGMQCNGAICTQHVRSVFEPSSGRLTITTRVSNQGNGDLRISAMKPSQAASASTNDYSFKGHTLSGIPTCVLMVETCASSAYSLEHGQEVQVTFVFFQADLFTGGIYLGQEPDTPFERQLTADLTAGVHVWGLTDTNSASSGTVSFLGAPIQ